MRNKLIILLVFLVLVLALASLDYAAPNAFSLRWWKVDGGGGTSQGGDYILLGTLGSEIVSTPGGSRNETGWEEGDCFDS